MDCVHLYYKDEHLARNHIGGLCDLRWETSLKCYKDGLSHICKKFEEKHEPEKSQEEKKVVQETPGEGTVPEKPSSTSTEIPVVKYPTHSAYLEKHYGKTKKK